MKFSTYKNYIPKKTEEGYILLLTLLVMSIILAISLGIFSISTREIILSTFLRDSAKSLAAANRGVECALYWDRSYPQNGMPYTIFATGTVGVMYTDPPAGVLSNAVCHDGTASRQISTIYSRAGTTDTIGVTTFSLNFSNGTCVDVAVTKVGNESTTIIGDGYNSCNVALLRRTQREIAVFTNI